MKINVFHEEATFEPKLWWLSPSGAQIGIAEWYDSDEETLEEDLEVQYEANRQMYRDEDYDLERTNYFEGNIFGDMNDVTTTFFEQAGDFIEKLRERDYE